jgi:cytochrome c biogenesis protein CcmG/thiol:disulfide interchange protein DsbE
MDKDRAIKIAKYAVLLGVVPLVLAILRPGNWGNPPGSIKPPSARKEMPDFTLRDVASGNPWQLSAHRGDVVLVNFWASWCEPCRAETPGLIRIARSYAPKGVAIAGISMDSGGTAPVRKFIQDFRVNYPLLMPDKKFALARVVDSLPTTFLMDRQGRIAKTYVGEVEENVFRADIDLLLGEPAPLASVVRDLHTQERRTRQ